MYSFEIEKQVKIKTFRGAIIILTIVLTLCIALVFFTEWE